MLERPAHPPVVTSVEPLGALAAIASISDSHPAQPPRQSHSTAPAWSCRRTAHPIGPGPAAGQERQPSPGERRPECRVYGRGVGAGRTAKATSSRTSPSMAARTT